MSPCHVQPILKAHSLPVSKQLCASKDMKYSTEKHPCSSFLINIIGKLNYAIFRVNMIDTKEFPDKAGRIYPPVVEIEYGDVTLKDLEEGRKMEFEFSVSYKMDIREAKKDIEVKNSIFLLRASPSGLRNGYLFFVPHLGILTISSVTLGNLLFQCYNVNSSYHSIPVTIQL